jgi:integrating conjugative element protein (TIGR03749 family)
MKKLLVSIIILTLWQSCCFANGFESLTLSDAEMQKLKKDFPVDEVSHQVWKGDPIFIQLPLNKEKRIIFPSHVLVDLKGAINTEQLRLINNDKSVYFTALQSFPRTRIYVTQENGEVILLDLSVDDSASSATQMIDIKQNQKVENSNQTIVTASVTQTQENDKYDSNSSSEPDDVSYVSLTRFAFAETYAPERVLKNITHYARAAMHTESFVSDLIYGDKVIAHPEGSWMANGRYITVISLQNKYRHITHIDIRKDLCGDWQAATIYPRSILKPQGNRAGDNTTLILISTKSFGETLGVCHGNA